VTTLTTNREHDLVDRCRRGDVAALDAIVEEHAADVHRLVHRITGRAGETEAVLNEVFAGLLLRGNTVEPGTPLQTWLYRQALQAVLARRGARAAADARLDAWLPRYRPDGHREGDRAFVTADWSAWADGRLLDAGARDALREIHEALGDVDRAMLVLASDGLSAETIAAIVGAPPTAVRDRLHRICMALRERITRALA
jgi:RNA polymerase sigma factor (sigma-70 family)